MDTDRESTLKFGASKTDILQSQSTTPQQSKNQRSNNNIHSSSTGGSSIRRGLGTVDFNAKDLHLKNQMMMTDNMRLINKFDESPHNTVFTNSKNLAHHLTEASSNQRFNTTDGGQNHSS